MFSVRCSMLFRLWTAHPSHSALLKLAWNRSSRNLFQAFFSSATTSPKRMARAAANSHPSRAGVTPHRVGAVKLVFHGWMSCLFYVHADGVNPSLVSKINGDVSRVSLAGIFIRQTAFRPVWAYRCRCRNWRQRDFGRRVAADQHEHSRANPAGNWMYD
jgi:hypothetical protein